MTPTLTWITTCKGRLQHLQQTLPRVVNQPGVACVVVDFSCPDGAADWVERNHPAVTVVRVVGEAGFNAARARNLGAAAASSEWLGFFDADIVWSADFAATVLPALQPGSFYRPEPVTPQTWGSFICRQRDFAAVGGYDEAMYGWGGEDDDLFARLRTAGCRPAGFAAALIGEIAHDDTLRTAFYEIKDRRLQLRINVIYMRVKYDLMTLLDQPLALDLRRTVFAEVRRTLLDADARGAREAVLAVTLPQIAARGVLDDGDSPWAIDRVLHYRVSLTAAGG